MFFFVGKGWILLKKIFCKNNSYGIFEEVKKQIYLTQRKVYTISKTEYH